MRGVSKVIGMVTACAALSLAPGHAAAQGNAQVLGTMAVADTGEIILASYAAQNVTRAGVRDYANMLVEQHSAHLQMVRDTAAALGVTPDTSAGHKLSETVQQQMQQMQGVSGTALDDLFLRFMVSDHQAVLNILLGTHDPRLARFVANTEVVVRQHLRCAERLQEHRLCRLIMSVHKDTGR